MAVLLTDAVRDIPGVAIAVPPAVNAVFAEVPLAAIEPLQAWSFFWEWDLTASLVRWMTSFATTPDAVERFAAGVRAIVADPLCPPPGHPPSPRTSGPHLRRTATHGRRLSPWSPTLRHKPAVNRAECPQVGGLLGAVPGFA